MLSYLAFFEVWPVFCDQVRRLVSARSSYYPRLNCARSNVLGTSLGTSLGLTVKVVTECLLRVGER